MQPFETDARNNKPTNNEPQVQPQAQGRVSYPTFEQGPGFQQGQPQAQQFGGYPTFQQGGYQPHQPNYQAPVPGQAYQQHPYGHQGYPVYHQGQHNMMAYNQGVHQAKDVARKQMLAQQLQKNIKASGQGLVILYSLLVVAASAGACFIIMNQDSYQFLAGMMRDYNNTLPDPFAIFSSDSCENYIGGMLAAPYWLGALAALNVLTMCIAMCNTSCCSVFHALAAIFFGGVSVITSQAVCVNNTLWRKMTDFFGRGAVPQNVWPYFAGMAVASLIACLLHCCWSSNKTKAEADQKNLALMMAA